MSAIGGKADIPQLSALGNDSTGGTLNVTERLT